ncbi:O-antigen ligase family protein [Metabacillus sp. HB246100]
MISTERKSKIPVQILSSTIISLLFSIMLFVANIKTNAPFQLLILSIMIVVGTLVLSLFMKKYHWEYVLLYLFIATSFFNSALLSIDVAFFSLFPYRIFFLMLLFLFFIKIMNNSIGLYESKVKWMISFFLAWLGYSGLSLIWSKSVAMGIKYIFLFFIGIMLIIFVNVYLKSLLQYLNFYYTWVFMTIILMGIGLWNHITEQQLSTSTLKYGPVHKLGIPTSTFVNQNDFATFLAISVYFFVGLLKYRKNKWLKLGSVISILTLLYLLYLTNSRASFLGLGIGIAFYIFVYMSYKMKKIILFFGTIGFVGIAYMGRSKIVSLFSQLLDNSAMANPINNDMNSVDIRINLIKNAFNYIERSLGFGLGPGNAEYYLQHSSKFYTSGIYKLHNWWLEIFVNFGFIIFTGYLLVIISIIVTLYKFLKTTVDNDEKMITETLLFAFITFIFASISPSSVSNLFFHWTLLAFGIGFINYLRNKKQKQV